METIALYRTAILACLRADAALFAGEGIESVVVTDTVTDNYLLIELGWEPRGRVHAPLIHIRLCEGRVCIEFDGTEEGITPCLVAAGIPPKDIVLGFLPPSERSELTITDIM